MATLHLLDVRTIESNKKHSSIFHDFDELVEGETLTILNDHDPVALYIQFQTERAGTFEWEYIERGPITWQVNITKTHTEETVADLVRQYPKAALVFKKLRIDFCCKGNRPLKAVCAEIGIAPEEVKRQISQLKEESANKIHPERWLPDFLADYIVQTHHSYVKTALPQLAELLEKVCTVHGKEYLALHEIANCFQLLRQELVHHMQKEEAILFPVIKELVRFNLGGQNSASYPFESIRNPIDMMEEEHIGAGEALEKIRELTNNFTPPAHACNSFRLLYQLLEDFETDLYQHVHLENNILFPKAIELENCLK